MYGALSQQSIHGRSYLAPTGHCLPAHRMLFSLLYSRNLYRLRLPATVPSASSGPSLAPPYARPNHRPRCAACSSEASICTVAVTGIRAADASLPKQPFPENYVSHRMPYSLTSVCPQRSLSGPVLEPPCLEGDQRDQRLVDAERLAELLTGDRLQMQRLDKVGLVRIVELA